MKPMFDPALRVQRRDRAARIGPETFLAERAFADILEQLAIMPTPPARALLVGAAGPDFVNRLRTMVGNVTAIDPSPVLARRCGATALSEIELDVAPSSVDLVIAFATLDTIDDLPGVLRRFALALTPGGMLIGVMPGGETLPRLRQAMRAADAVGGAATPRVHPRIEPQALTGLLSGVGLANPVVDVDRIELRYADFGKLVADLRAMAATNILLARSRKPLGKAALAAAIADFGASGEQRTTESIELLHFAAWKPSSTSVSER